jgi:peptidoglycan/xylan/chitin deacetylase (PgdA/CDA1 family)
MSAKKKLLETLYAALHYSGASSIYSKLSKSESAVALMYHSVSSEKDRNWIDPDNDMPIELFEEQMHFLHKNCNVVSLDHLQDLLVNHEPIEPRTVLITFDDGYRNNLINAAPILKKYDLPATIYLATAYIDSGDPQWIDELYSYFRHRKSDHLELPNLGKFNLSTMEEKTKAYSMLKHRMVESTMEERRLILLQVNKQLGATPIPEKLTLSWADLDRIVCEFPNLAIGFHTKSHADLTGLDSAASAMDIKNGMLDLERNLGLKPRHFSYPYGKWNDQIRTQVKRAALHSAITSEPVPAITAVSDIYTLPRIEAPRNKGILKYMVSGAYPRLSQLIFKRPYEAMPEIRGS